MGEIRSGGSGQWERDVDGTASASSERQRRIGVLSLHNSKETKAVLNAVEALGHEPVWLRESNTRLHIDDAPVMEPDVDAVVNRLLLSKAETPLEDLELAAAISTVVPVLNPPRAVLTAIHKYATAMALAKEGVATPGSALALDPAGDDAETRHLSGPTVNKPAIGTHGDDAFKVEADDDDRMVFRGGEHTVHQSFLEQESAQSDLRVYVVGGDVVAAMERTAPEDDWRANVARGGSTHDASDALDERTRRLAKRATSAIGLDVAGVDLMERDDEWYVLEVNPTAGFTGLFDATGVSPAPFIARAAIERAGGAVDDEAVRDLAERLNDSVPSCKPGRETAGEETPTIGYTETVGIAGTDQMRRVVGKVDTGADRTSIGVELAGQIGAGPITGHTAVRSASDSESTKRPLVDVHLSIEGPWERVTASVQDRSHMNYPLILGRDVLSGYQIDIDKRVGDGSDGGAGAVAYADEE